MSNFVIRGGRVITMDAGVGVLPEADVLVVDGRVRDVAERVEAGPDVEVVDASRCVVLPGFVDSHRHLWQTAMRGQLADCTLGDYFRRILVGMASSVTAEEVHAATLLGCYQLLDAGITGVVDWANIINTPEHADAGITALLESGIRGVYAYGWPAGVEHLFHSTTPHPEDARRVAARYFGGTDGLVTLGLGLRGPVSNPPEVLISDWRLGRDIGARLNVHTGMRVPGIPSQDITILDRTGLMGPDTTYVHCTNSTDAEFGRIADTGGHVSVAAHSEMVMGHGHPPTARLLAAGLAPSLSADIVASSPGDMFSQMRVTLAQARISAYPDDPAAPFDPTVTAYDVLRCATTNGAEALGRADRVGVLRPGMDADIVLIRTDRVNAMPDHDPVATVVTQVDTSNVDSVWVRGRPVKRAGVLLDVDPAKLERLADRLRDSMRAKMVP
ncbi:cytosine/adenosine deaminase-related metal-dependent hydrolase [Saccharothrix saharensis]|uniref:Cytosine/adenosine deaminase-related metal-dependent hydrolase n=1 Tax=Saccharothrix saharensis TaxID=571190 RepID=A0A543J8X7_9PSEU|nr:amidohydrolase family protein [Saccharothrix saharensis]TQM79277.1 cytosine/adenosine deaminase-related metal-dependent hydrolase [Saccharothrix saharensis]